jgi:hypothetical protein
MLRDRRHEPRGRRSQARVPLQKSRVMLSAYEGPVHTRRSAISAVLFAFGHSAESRKRSVRRRFKTICNRKAPRLNLSLHRVPLGATC